MLSRLCTTIFLGVALAWSAMVCAEEKHSRQVDSGVPSAEQVKQLIDRLNDDDYRVREKATEVLASLGEEIHPQLRQNLLANKNTEVELRLRLLLGTAEDRRLIAPALCVSNYCLSVCDGNEETARKCLSRESLESLDSTGKFPTAPIDGAFTFKINTVEHTIINDTTIIFSTWFYRYENKLLQRSIGFFLTREIDGWKISLIEDPSVLQSSSNPFFR